MANFERGATTALQFIKQAFDGTLPKFACGSNATVLDFGSQENIDLVGTETDTFLNALFQQTLADGQ